MGLDVTVFLGRIASTQLTPRRGSYFSIVATVELDYEGRAMAVALQSREGDPPVFLYAAGGDGNRHTSRDRYGTRLRAVPVEALRSEAAVAKGWLQRDDPGHRLKMLRGMLRALPRWVTHAVVFCH